MCSTLEWIHSVNGTRQEGKWQKAAAAPVRARLFVFRRTRASWARETY